MTVLHGPQTAASKRICSEHVYEWHRDKVRANPSAYTPLKVARYAARLRQADLAAQAGVSRGRLSAYENGAVPQTERTRVSLANALGVQVKELFAE